MEGSKSLIGKSFLRNAYFGYGAQGLKISLGFAWVMIVTTVAGIQAYGMVALLTSLSGLVSNLLTFRTNEAVVKFYKTGARVEDVGQCRLALMAGLVLDTVVALILFAAIRIFADAIAADLLKDPAATAAVIAYSWVVLANFMRGTGMGLLTASESFRAIYSLTVVEQLARIGLLLVVLQYDVAITLDTIVLIILFPAIATSTFVVALPVVKLCSLRMGVKISMASLRNYLAFSISTFTSSALKAGNRGVDNLILGVLSNPESVGIYNLIKRFLSPLSIIVGPFYAQIYPKFVRAVDDGESERIRLTIISANKAIAKWSLVLFLTISAAVALYWSYMEFSFSSENLFTFILVAMTTFLFQQLWWSRGFALSTDPSISIRGNMLQTFLAIPLIYILTMKFGLVGTALGMFGTGLCISGYWYLELSKYSSKRSRE